MRPVDVPPDDHSPRLATNFTILNQFAGHVRLNRNLERLSAVRAADVEEIQAVLSQLASDGFS